jgi:sugar phosphate isomerase/epimerase
MLAELDKQGFNGYYVIEYEDNWMNNIPEIKECAEYLRKN